MSEDTAHMPEAIEPNTAHPAVDVGKAYQEHAPFIARVIEKLTGSGPHVDDILQETFIIAYKKRDQFERRSALRTWLYGIAKNLCMHHKRGLARFLNFKDKLQAIPASDSPSPHKTLEVSRELALAESVITSMTFKQREVFVLYELEEMEGPEIADLLDIPIGTVWTRLHKARQVFQARLEKKRMREETT
jgi:RNA polymerase sigma-70 factor (ECF subfamily)